MSETTMTPRVGRRWRRLLALTASLALLALACGDDEGASVRELDDGGSASESATGSGSASGSGSGSASATAAADAECTPVNPDLEADADEVVELDAVEYAFEPADIGVDAGVVTFAVTNAGGEAHELAFLPGGGDVPYVDGEPDEAALAEAGAFELEAFGPGQTCNATYELEPGTYTIFCIVETADGVTHDELGMHGTLTVG